MEPLVPNDPRVEHKYLSVGDHTYHYILAKPKENSKATVVLLHGWPDISLGWRYQVPYLTSLGLEVIAPDMLGYGQTSAPDSPDEYTLKKMAAHIAAIIKAHASQPVILGGHDWGGALVWRIAMYHPELIRGAFSFCFPYLPASPAIPSLEKLVEHFPNFRYQLSNRAGAVEAAIGNSPTNLKLFVSGAYGGTTPEGEPVFDPVQGIHEDRIPRIGASPLLSTEWLEYYSQEFHRHGLRGPCNWYRTHALNNADELAFAGRRPNFKFDIPAMIIMAEHDGYLPPALADDMETHFAQALEKDVIASYHWTLLEKPEESNELIGDFIAGVLE